ncbi:amino acid adenylation domain-containing protein [Dactylosporangium sp. NPDC000244]|uniref:amino acid adenylation domain-containing protein n=1 Tax=Dactylosporangium sp. NPDC000244 TaxID=3154365 RepID=UPI0033294C54
MVTPALARLDPDRRAALARLVAARRAGAGRAPDAIAPRPAGDGPVPCSPAQRRIWVADRLGEVPAATFGLRLRGRLDVAALRRAFVAVAARHEAMRTVYELAGDQPVQRVLERTEVRLDVRAGDPHAIAADAVRERFDLATGPIFRITLVETAPDDHVLLFVGHHIAFDEHSVGLVRAEVARAYAGQDLGAPPALQYADYAAWAAARPVREERARYWRERLAGLGDTRLPFAREHAPGAPTRALRLELAPGSLHRLRAATPFTALLAALGDAVARYTRDPDVSIGTISSGRPRVELEPVVGCFLNPVPLRTDLTGARDLAAVAERVRRTVAGALAHEVPFETLLRGGPLFRVALHLHQPHAVERWRGLRAEVWHHDVAGVEPDLVLEAAPRPDGGAELAFRHSALEEGVLEHFAEHVRRLAEGRPAEAPRPVYWRKDPRTVLDLIDAQAARTPDAIALEDADGRTRTYAELMSNVDKRAAGIRGRLVPIAHERTPELVEEVLAVWRAGAAYVPVDPGYPPARQELILADARAGDPGAGVAYVLHTSGSTGRPKGVVVEHHALTNFVLDMAARLESRPEHRWLAVTSLNFDIAGLELFLPLVTGGRIVLADAEAQRDGHRLDALIARAGVTHVQTTPSRWRLLLAAGFDRPDVVALVGGEALPPALARELRARSRETLNVYGPTETTIWSAAWPVPEAPDEVLIGAPIAYTHIRICDEDGHELPTGAIGELCIGGLGVARGYLGRPALTADRFRPDPWGAPGDRLYRTGDLARWGADGQLRFLGRADNQIKLAGHRIELGEIEAHLAALPGVRQAAVAVRDERLVAYVVGAPERNDLAEQLPGHMVPRVYVTLDALPLTPNGKLDRAALPDPEPVAAAGPAPRTETERLVADIWAEALGRDGIGVDADFFALGGHSLPAMTVAARLSVACGYEVAVRTVFAHPTVAALAAAVDELVNAPDHTRDVPVTPRPDPAAPAPLSPAQLRLWFLQVLQPDDAAYNMALVYRLRGPLDADRLRSALELLAERHDTLRTRFLEDDGGPAQVVTDRRPVLERGSLDDIPRWTNRPFDLGEGMLLRAGLVTDAEDEHVLCLVMHHIAGDGRSLGILCEELRAAYAREPLPPLPVRYTDFAEWQRARGDERDLAYWTRRLAGVAHLDLPTDRPRPAVQTSRGAFARRRLGAGLADTLDRLGGAHGCTPFMVLLAGYQALLARHTGQTDISVGTSVSDRARPELTGLIGMFINTLVLRTDVSGDPSFAELLGRVREVALGAYAHPEIPFERLAADLGLPRDPSRTELFQTMLILHTEEGATTDLLPGIAAEHVDDGLTQAKFDLMLDAWREPDGVQLALNYRTDLFDAATAERLLARLERLLTAAAADPARPLSTLDLLAPGEREALVALGTGPSGEVQDPPAPDPAAIALSFKNETLTYGELHDRAARQAGWLRDQGVRPDDRVAVLMPRSIDLIVTLLAVLKAGAAYVPIDPRYPAARRELLAEGCALTVTSVEQAEPYESTVDPQSLAYVIYTSGSTGTPKGVGVSRHALRARVSWMRRRYDLKPGDVVAQFATVSFDTHVEEVWPTLAAGARLVLLPPDEDLSDLLAREPVTVLDLPTPYWHELVGTVEWPASLRLLILGADTVRADRLAAWYAEVGDRVEVLNTYGPTETTVIATTGALGPAETSIGTPIADTRVYVLDEHLRLTPTGVPGELCVAGDGVARGYLGRPGLTADRFRPDPYGPPGARLYRTGDRARWRPDGRLEFLGRLDDQVKIRGYRVEPGEVETVLGGLPGVAQAAVVVRDGALAAYAAGEGLDPDALRRALAERLPAFLVPAHCMVLDRVPLTVNGKVDRAALPAPVAAAGGYVAPRTPAEDLVAQIWAGVLGVERVGAHDDFFALGGHSLLAIAAVARLCAATGRDVPVRALFLDPTVAGLAAAVDRHRQEAPVVRRGLRRGPLSFGQQRLWFLHQLDPEDASYNIAVAYRLRGPLDADRLEAALNAVVARHESLRTRFIPTEDEPLQEVTDARLTLEHGEDVSADVPAWTNRPFDLESGLLLRAGLVTDADDDHVLALVVHHIAGDGRSLGVLVRELRAEYAGEPVAEPPVQYGDFAVWQRERDRDQLDYWCDQLDYWRGQLTGVPILDLPTDRPRPEMTGFEGAFLVHDLPASLATGVRRLAAEARCTPFMVLLSVYEVLLARLTGQDDFCVGTPIENRPRVEVADLVGYFVNTLALRADLAGDPTFRELLGRTRDTALAAYAHQDAPFDRLLAAVDVPRRLNRTPLFQTMFTFHTEEAAGTDVLPGVDAAFHDPGGRQVKYELTLDVWRTADGLRLVLGHRTDLFDRATAEALAHRFEALATALLSNPDGPLSTVDAGGDAEARAALRRSVRAPRAVAKQGPATFVPPRDAAEELVAGVWREVLGLERVGVHDDFFAAGGHSLLAMKVAGRLRAATGTTVPLRTMFAHPVLADLAVAVEELIVADLNELSDDEAERLLGESG